MTVYPNPANQSIAVLSNFVGENTITIIDAVEIMMQMNTSETLLEINISICLQVCIAFYCKIQMDKTARIFIKTKNNV
ncbi:MAG: hypothetical protein IPQ11_16355 [Bacteroidetes bacterium]|nr:hypothetical protein [Bacteroidota bacterium]